MRVTILLCLTLVGLASSKVTFNLDPPKVVYARPWDQGVNICAYLSKPGLAEQLYTYCLPWKQDYCGGKTSFRYECCPGFKRTPKFDNKCVERERTWKVIPDLLKIRGHKRYANLLTNSGSGAGFREIQNQKSQSTFTVFVPYKDSMLDQAETKLSNFGGRKGNHPILFSVVAGRYYTDNLRNGMTLKSQYQGHDLKVTKYSNGIICIECKELIEPDHEAKNGVIHYFNGVMTPHTGTGKNRQSVMQTLQSDPQLSQFAAAIPQDLRKVLSEKNSAQWYTVFAPSNAVWSSTVSRYPGSAQEIARNHVMRNMFCKAALVANVKNLGPTEAKERLESDCGSGGGRTIRSQFGPPASVTRPDLVSSNGVVHVIDNVLVPSKVMSFKQILNSGRLKGAQNWINYMKECDLRMTPGNSYAVLIPMMRAFTWWQGYKRFRPYYDRFQTDAAFRCRLIRFHIFAATNQKLSTLPYQWLQQSGYRTNNFDKLWHVDYFMRKAWGSMLWWHYSPVSGFKSIPFKGGSFYYIDRVNMIPEKRIIDILPTRSELSTTNKRTRASNMDNLVFKKNEPLNLYLAIRNKGWKEVPEADQAAQADVLNFLKLHWVANWLWGGDIGYFEAGTRHRFMSGAGLELIFDREIDGNMYIGYEGLDRKLWALVVEWNLFAIDGNIWIIDKPLTCPPTRCRKKQLEIEIWKVLTFACWESLRARRGAKAREMEPWLDQVEGNQCFTNREVPKATKSEHEERK